VLSPCVCFCSYANGWSYRSRDRDRLHDKNALVAASPRWSCDIGVKKGGGAWYGANSHGSLRIGRTFNIRPMTVEIRSERQRFGEWGEDVQGAWPAGAQNVL
jgi:hypothetical protein